MPREDWETDEYGNPIPEQARREPELAFATFGDGTTSGRVIAAAIGRRIERIAIEENELLITLPHGVLGLFDDGQSCCERRYMRTDDDLPYFVGARFLGAEVATAAEVPRDEDSYGEHEIQFLRILTSRGVITIANHNEHNGYYGGFSLVAVRRDP